MTKLGFVVALLLMINLFLLLPATLLRISLLFLGFSLTFLEAGIIWVTIYSIVGAFKVLDIFLSEVL